MNNPIHWIKYKYWFLFDLPLFIKENKYKKGLELGVKEGRSMYFALKSNKELHYTGIDLWEVIEGKAYKNNKANEAKCRKKLKEFEGRHSLIKGDTFDISEKLEDQSYDFIFYDLQCKHMEGFHSSVIKKYLPKIKKGGVLIGCDFRSFRYDFYALGFKESDFKPCQFKNQRSQRLEYLHIN